MQFLFFIAAETPARPAKFFGSIWQWSSTGAAPDNFIELFNQTTPENCGRWGNAEPSRGYFDWTRLDAMYAWAEAGNTLYAGAPATLSWRCFVLPDAFIDNGIGTVSGAGYAAIVPTQTLTYTIAASAGDQAYADTAVVTVKPLLDPSATVSPEQGLDYKYYEGSWTVLPDFESLIPVKTGSCTGFDISAAERADNFGFLFEGYIEITLDGVYTFSIVSDDGSRLYMDGNLVADNDGIHSAYEVAGTIGLKSGKHAIRVEYFDESGGQSLEVNMQGEAIASGSLFRSYSMSSAKNLLRSGTESTDITFIYNIQGRFVGVFNSVSPIRDRIRIPGTGVYITVSSRSADGTIKHTTALRFR